jgi:hypothetical protein
MIVIIEYTNWRGDRAKRRIAPTGNLRFGTSPFHPDQGWLLEAVDLTKLEKREFALKSIHSWEEEELPRPHPMMPSEEEE